MGNQQSKLDKAVKISVIFILFLTAISIFYYFLIRPYSKNRNLKKCLKITEEHYNKEKQVLESEMQFLYSQRSTKEIEKQEIEKQKKGISCLNGQRNG